MKKQIYLDNGATTKVADEAVKAMQPFFSEIYGNPSSLHSFGQEAKKALENSRSIIAKKINADPSEIFFTSGGSESNNLAIKGVAYSKKDMGNHIITSKIEHPCIMETCKELEKNGFKVTYLNVDKYGFIDLKQLESKIIDKTILISIMHANNEIGTILQIEDIAKICKKHKVLFHSDMAQSFTKVPIDVKKLNIDIASFSAHKIHGPKGIGAIYIRKGVALKAQIIGGHQESGIRAGTENIPAIIGFAKATEIITSKDIIMMKELRDYLIKEISKIKGTILNGSKTKRLCNNISFCFPYIEGESLVMHLDLKGIASSTGSACSQKTLDPSHVLLAIGLKPEVAHGSLRLTLSKYTTKEEIDYAIDAIKSVVKKLQDMSPLGKR